MKRIFKKFLASNKVSGLIKRGDYSQLTVLFNKWVGQAKVESAFGTMKRFHFHAHANKFQVRKWIEKGIAS